MSYHTIEPTEANDDLVMNKKGYNSLGLMLALLACVSFLAGRYSVASDSSLAAGVSLYTSGKKWSKCEHNYYETGEFRSVYASCVKREDNVDADDCYYDAYAVAGCFDDTMHPSDLEAVLRKTQNCLNSLPDPAVGFDYCIYPKPPYDHLWVVDDDEMYAMYTKYYDDDHFHQPKKYNE